MDMLNRLKSTVTGVLPGNPVTREFEILNHRASAGPGLLWKVFDGVKRTTKQEVSIFVFEKKLIERYSKRDKDLIVEVLKKGVAQLTKLRHPKILSVLHPLEESRESLAFAAEPVFASLANVLGFHENLPSPPPADLKDHKLFDVEIKYGFMQVTEGLTFLHSSVHLVHCNLSPSSIIINRSGNWKICGFEFCIPNANTADQAPYFPGKEWDPDLPPVAQPSLDYLAPEFALTMSCDTYSDMFSLGVLFYAVFNGGKPIYECCHQINSYKRNVEQLRNLKLSILGSIPAEVRDHIKLLLNTEPTVRPDADQLSKIPFFEDVGVMTLQYLDTLMQRDNLQKSQFFKGLAQVIGKMPKRVNMHRILPCVMKESVNSDMIPFLLPNVLLIAEQASDQEYVKYIMPHLIPIFKIQEPIQIMLIFLQNMNLLLSKTPQADIKNHVLPMVYRALELNSPQIQGLCLNIIPTFASLIDYSSIKNAIVPRIRRLCMTTTTLNIRVSCLLCLGKMLEYMDKWYVLDEIFPILQEVPSREPAVLMSVLGIYKVAMSHKKLGITKDVMATKVLPFIIPLSIDNNLNLSQFNAYMSVVKEMISKVESEHRSKLDQLNSMQQEQRTLQFTEQSVKDSQSLVPGMASEPKQETMIDKFLSGFGFGSMFSSSSTAPEEKARDSPATNGTSPTENRPSLSTSDNKLPNRPAQVNLTLEEKQRLAQQQEQQQRFKSQTSLATKSTSPAPKPVAATPPPNKPAVKDLTSTLMNTDFMNTQSKITTGHSSGFSSATTSVFPSSASSGMGGVNRSGTGFGGQSSVSSNMVMGSSGFGSQPAGFSQPKPQQTKQVDMSAFDNLLPASSSSQARKPMNQISQPRPPQPAGFGMQQGMMGNMGTMGGSRMMGNQGMMGNMGMGMQPMGNQTFMGQQGLMGQQGMMPQPMNMNSSMGSGNVKSEFDTLFG